MSDPPVGDQGPFAFRARVRGYDPATHRATLQPVHGPRGLLDEAAVLTACPPRHLTDGREVAVLAWADGGTLVLGPWAPGPARPMQAWTVDEALRAFTATDWADHPGLCLALTLEEAAYLQLYAALSVRASAARALAYRLRLTVDDAPVAPSLSGGCALADLWQPVAHVQRTADALPPGERVIRLQVCVQQAGDAVWLQSCGLGAIALSV